MEIERELQNGHSQVAKSTVGDIWKYRQKLEDYISSSETPLYAKRRCVVRGPKCDVLVVSG